jgi:CRISPR/Cas system-associated endoribonuclease Cas2
MKDFGIRLQFSIFICRLGAGDMMRCREKLKKVLVRYGSERKPNDSLIIFEHIQSEAVDCLLGTQIENIPPMFKIF